MALTRNLMRLAMATTLLVLAACGPSDKPLTGQKVGKPYMISGKMYYPEADIDYDEVGTASWYGPGFHGKYTASGEVYNQHALTAAHTTLPLPSMVRVTNLDNGKSAIIRVNDRGPFAESRIIDLSKASAQKLGVTGLARVRVQYLHEETMAYLQSKGIKPTTQFAEAKSTNNLATNTESVAVASDEEIAREAETVRVQTADLQEFKPRPVQRFSIVNDAEASEISTQDLSPPSPPVRGREVASPKLIRLGDEPENMPRIDTSSEARRFDGAQPAETEQAPVTTTSSAPIQPAAGQAPVPGLYVQAGSFGSRENAIHLADKLSSIGPSEVNMVEISGKTWYRVRVGPIQGNGDAILTKVKETGITDARLVHQ